MPDIKSFKKENKSSYADALLMEVQGLKLLNKGLKQLKTPNVLDVDEQILKVEFIESIPFDQYSFTKLANGLVDLHRFSNTEFGLDYDNYIGLGRQPNRRSSNWGEFFWKQRLEYQLLLMKEVGEEFLEDLDSYLIIEFLNDHNPKASLVHGDLWSGNIMFNGKDVYLIDPAVYFGDREVDIAMSKLFGGFDRSFYQAYENEWPFPSGSYEREVIYNLYHLLNHYNIFGQSYLSQVRESVLKIKSFF